MEALVIFLCCFTCFYVGKGVKFTEVKISMTRILIETIANNKELSLKQKEDIFNDFITKYNKI